MSTNTTNTDAIVTRILDKLETINACYGLRSEFTVREAYSVLGLLGLECSEKAIRHRIERDQVEYRKADDGTIRLPVSSVVELAEKQIKRGRVTSDDWLPFISSDQARDAKERGLEMTQFCQQWATQPFGDVVTELLTEQDERKRRLLVGIALAQHEAELRVARGEA